RRCRAWRTYMPPRAKEAPRQKAPRSPKRRSGWTKPLLGVDGRSGPARRFRALCVQFAAELGGELTAADREVIRQAAVMQMHVEKLQASILRGEAVLSDELVRLSSESRRVLGTLREKAMKRKPDGPSLADYLAKRSARGADEDDA